MGEHFYSLSAALPVDGRAIPIYWEVHPEAKLQNRKVQNAFLKTLKLLLPNAVKPVIVTDAGYQSPWFKTVTDLGWNYVGRLSGRVYLDLPEAGWCRVASLYAFATKRNKDLGVCRVTMKSKSFRRVILGKEFARNPERSKTKRRRSDRGRSNEQAKKRSQEPWVITTSLSSYSADQIIKIYAGRMQIEESYRDVKNHRFGWSFSHAKSRDTKRLEILLLIATIANIVMTLVGQAAEAQGIQRRYQANTIKTRRVLSQFFLGKCIIERDDMNWCEPRMIKNALSKLRQDINALEHLQN